MIITDFAIQLDRDVSRDRIARDLGEDTPSDLLEDAYTRLAHKEELIFRPMAVLEFGELEGKKALFLLITLGQAVANYTRQAYRRGAYLEMLTCDAMANRYLFEAKESLLSRAEALCRERGFYVADQFEPEAGDPRLPEILRQCKAERALHVSQTGAGMLTPEKTMCQVFLLEDACTVRNEDENGAAQDGGGAGPQTGRMPSSHDCGKCGRTDCTYRK